MHQRRFLSIVATVVCCIVVVIGCGSHGKVHCLLKVGVTRDRLGTTLLLLNTTIPDELRRRDRGCAVGASLPPLDMCKSLVSLIVADRLSIFSDRTGPIPIHPCKKDTVEDLLTGSLLRMFPCCGSRTAHFFSIFFHALFLVRHLATTSHQSCFFQSLLSLRAAAPVRALAIVSPLPPHRSRRHPCRLVVRSSLL